MGSRTISLEESAYRLLKNAKREGESFSDVVKRLLGKERPPLLEFGKILSKESADALATWYQGRKAERRALDADRRRRSWGDRWPQ